MVCTSFVVRSPRESRFGHYTIPFSIHTRNILDHYPEPKNLVCRIRSLNSSRAMDHGLNQAPPEMTSFRRRSHDRRTGSSALRRRIQRAIGPFSKSMLVSKRFQKSHSFARRAIHIWNIMDHYPEPKPSTEWDFIHKEDHYRAPNGSLSRTVRIWQGQESYGIRSRCTDQNMNSMFVHDSASNTGAGIGRSTIRSPMLGKSAYRQHSLRVRRENDRRDRRFRSASINPAGSR